MIFKRKKVKQPKQSLICFKGKLYRDEGKTWIVSSDLHRHDGHFLYLRRDEDNRIVMKEVRADQRCVIEDDNAG